MARYIDNELPEACKICLEFKAEGQRQGPHFVTEVISDVEQIRFLECGYSGNQNRCLPKDRAIIILLDKLLKKLE